MARSFSGRRLRDARIAAGKRPERLALDVDRSVYSINEYETERVTPPLSVALKLAAALGCALDDLLTEETARVA